MSCCSDVMTPIEAEDTAHLKLVGVVTEHDVYGGVAADDQRAWKRSCDHCLPVVMRASRLKQRAGNSTSIARGACPLRIRRAVAAASSALTVWRSLRAPDEGIGTFDEPFDKLMETLRTRHHSI